MKGVLGMVALLLLAIVPGCAGDGSTQAHWVTLDGRPADQAEVQAAATRCQEKVPHVRQARARWSSVEWGVAMVDCLREEGYVRALREESLPDLDE